MRVHCAGEEAPYTDRVLRKRFDVNEVPAGREYVEAYVPYIHYVETLWLAATSGTRGHREEPHSEHAAHPH